ncbi:uncharacterized protein LOC133901567 isoform X2 [Phragmites australis]|uniref:uncharacterized protein LOC133901567 isoform X2 n=1 Tax=Phragmites australis TaxID=29695 RepID=UPI002D77BB52|nr:uncharacterized protein LOC133901567 isoform X2 [Phragmites australis]
MPEMTESWVEGSKHAPAPESVSCSVSRYQTLSERRSRQRNIFHILAQREVSTQTKHQAKRLWTKSPRCDDGSVELKFFSTDARHDLFSWAESQSLHRWSAKYCPLVPAPRSTIAAAFSPDGRTLASTHGDHTVKIIDYQTGKCLKELLGHQRTPWVVRYHPLHSDIVASGSLDHEVRLWDAKTSHCIGEHFFYRPIASIAFHATGELLAVASGHKLFIWDYSKQAEALDPAMILKTRRSLRAVHFHPHGAPYLLTAEVNDLDSGDSTLTPATSSGYSNCCSAVILANINSMCCPHLESRLSSSCLLWPAYLRDDGIICPLCNDRDIDSINVQQGSSSLVQNSLLSDAENQEISQLVTSMDACPGETGVANDDDSVSTSLYAGTEMYTVRVQSNSRVYGGSAATNERFRERDGTETSHLSRNIPNPEIVLHSRPDGPSGMPMDRFTTSSGLPYMHNLEHVDVSSSVPATAGNFIGSRRHYTSHPDLMASVPGVGSLLLGTQIDEAVVHAVSLGVGSELPTSLFDGSGTELPCTVKLRIWRHNIKDPCVAFELGTCRLTISHAVLCSEMGTHFSPCGRFLVACVACMLPQTEGDHGSQLPVQYDSTGAGTSPTRHPLPSHQIIYELRVYSLEEATFGTVLASRAIRAANCLTSIQVYRVSDMELVRVLPSALDEVNVACFHPSPGAGLVYGTKEGKLRILQHNGGSMGLNFFAGQNMLEVQRHAL